MFYVRLLKKVFLFISTSMMSIYRVLNQWCEFTESGLKKNSLKFKMIFRSSSSSIIHFCDTMYVCISCQHLLNEFAWFSRSHSRYKDNNYLLNRDVQEIYYQSIIYLSVFLYIIYLSQLSIYRAFLTLIYLIFYINLISILVFLLINKNKLK